VEKSADFLERVAASEPIARKLAAIQRAEWPARFSHVIQSAQPFLAAVIANAYHSRRIDKRDAADFTIWVLCPSVHSQESFYESLLNWRPDALFLPGSRVNRNRKCLAGSGNHSGTAGVVFTNRARHWSQDHRGGHARASINLRQNTEASTPRLFNFDAERPRRWKNFSSDL
jgi:hypothetical protein